jgi:succinoglycan biosynthesis protein ExoM
VIDWKKGRTGNVLLKKSILNLNGPVFRPQFRTGEDQDLFRRLIAKGYVFIWCHEAMAYEAVPSGRWNRRFMLRRALLRGATSRLHATFGAGEVAKSLIAVPAYMLALPFACLLGRGRYMALLVRLCDHVGKLMALVGLNPVGEPYVTE